ncbi:MAG TPA: lysylphosphatidylglycerol synthase domain-containing protein [Anaeromyxobacter sp.]
MPLGKRLAVVAAVLATLALAAAGVALASSGSPRPGGALAAAALAAGVLALHVFWPPFDLGLGSLRRGARSDRRAALTFDDGPSADTPAVLDALERAGVRATFFVLGVAAERRPELVREVARRGHEVALHGHTHARLALAGPREVAKEIDRGREAIRRAGVEPAPWFRAPHGWKGPFLGRALRARGLRLVAWTRGAWDTERPGAGAIAERAARRPRPGEIVLLHDGCGTPGIDARRDQTAAAVPEIVRRWRAAGFELVTVGALAASSPPGVASAGRALRLGALAGGVALAAFALARVDLRAVGASLAGARPALLALGVGANLVSLATHAARWRAVVIAPGGRVRYRDALVAILAGFAAGLVLPGRGGDLLRAHLLARRARVSTAAVVAASALDYVVGTVAFVVALAALGAAAPLPSWGLRALALMAALAAAAAAAAFLLRPGRGPARSSGLVARLRGGLAALHDARALATSIGWGLAGWVAEGAIALATLAALGLPATPTAAALVVIAASAAAAVGISPGNAGTFEVATAIALAGLGVPTGAAVAFALAFHAVHVVPVALLGGAMLLREGVTREGLARERP